MSGENGTIIKRGGNQPPLPRPVQEHLGRKLRAQLYEVGEKPSYLGDPVIPREFDPLIEQLAKRDRARAADQAGLAGYQAVAAALMDFQEAEPGTFDETNS